MIPQVSEAKGKRQMVITWEALPDENGRNWVASMGLFLGTWQGTKQGRTGLSTVAQNPSIS